MASVGGGGGGGGGGAPTLSNKDEILKVFQSMTRQRDSMTDKLSELIYSHSEYKCVPLPPLRGRAPPF